MKLTISELLNAKPAIDALGAIDGYTARLAGYRISRLAARILPDFAAADTERSKLLRRYGATVRPNDPEPGMKTLVSLATHDTLRVGPMSPAEVKDPNILLNVQAVIPNEIAVEFNCEMGDLMAQAVEVEALPLPFELFLDQAGNPIPGTERLIGQAGPFVEEPYAE